MINLSEQYKFVNPFRRCGAKARPMNRESCGVEEIQAGYSGKRAGCLYGAL
ncbi:MAG: hypothetical protein KHX56_16920 [Clostridiales bacterium]|nr:hypothetical protein [Clostridiales bacterium]